MLTNEEIEHAVHWMEQYQDKELLETFSVEKVLNSAKKWTKKLINQAQNVVESDNDIEICKDLGNDFKLVKLINEKAYQYEGREMKHCVASYSKGSSTIYSIRDKFNKPHCTIEISGNRVGQIKGKSNQFVVDKYVPYVMEALTYLDVDMSNSNDLKNIGLSLITDDLLDKLTLGAVKLNFFDAKAYKRGERLPTVKIGKNKYINQSSSYWKQ